MTLSDKQKEAIHKGILFEKWVKDHLFPSKYFTLEYQTPPYEAGSDRRIESMLKPDFQFKCKKSGKPFWVEAKYRSNLIDDYITWAKPGQWERYRELDSEKAPKAPVFVVIGYQGTPDNPDKISLFHITDIKYPKKLFKSVLEKFDIEKTHFDEEAILKRFPRRKIKNNYIWVAVFSLLIIVAAIFYKFNQNKPKQDNSKDKIYSYFTDMQMNRLNVDNYFAQNVLQFITRTNLTLNDVKNSIATSKTEFTNQQFRINHNDILLNRIENEIKYYSFWMHYKCFRVSMHKTEDCDVNVEIGINNSDKFISYREIKIENLKFY